MNWTGIPYVKRIQSVPALLARELRDLGDIQSHHQNACPVLGHNPDWTSENRSGLYELRNAHHGASYTIPLIQQKRRLVIGRMALPSGSACVASRCGRSILALSERKAIRVAAEVKVRMTHFSKSQDKGVPRATADVTALPITTP